MFKKHNIPEKREQAMKSETCYVGLVLVKETLYVDGLKY